MGPFIHDATLRIREFFKSLIYRAYTWYINLKLGLVCDFDHLLSLSNAKFFCADAKSSLTKLVLRRCPREDMDATLRD